MAKLIIPINFIPDWNDGDHEKNTSNYCKMWILTTMEDTSWDAIGTSLSYSWPNDSSGFLWNCRIYTPNLSDICIACSWGTCCSTPSELELQIPSDPRNLVSQVWDHPLPAGPPETLPPWSCTWRSLGNGSQFAMENGPFIEDLPMEMVWNGGSFHSYFDITRE